MDLIAILILGSTLISATVAIVGPLMELRGKILFANNKNKPRTTGRIGMRMMVLGAVIFILGLASRSFLSGDVVTPIVMIGYAVWFVGGFVAVIRNEVIKACGEEEGR